uniref:Uncharacterized protein n=1 Tax=Helianthus annuus TaxID=4232 RepID=A0A251S4N4_HELAN
MKQSSWVFRKARWSLWVELEALDQQDFLSSSLFLCKNLDGFGKICSSGYQERKLL